MKAEAEICIMYIFIFNFNLRGCLLHFQLFRVSFREIVLLYGPSTDNLTAIFSFSLYLISHIIAIFNSLQDTYESNQWKIFSLLCFCFQLSFHGYRATWTCKDDGLTETSRILFPWLYRWFDFRNNEKKVKNIFSIIWKYPGGFSFFGLLL